MGFNFIRDNVWSEINIKIRVILIHLEVSQFNIPHQHINIQANIYIAWYRTTLFNSGLFNMCGKNIIVFDIENYVIMSELMSDTPTRQSNCAFIKLDIVIIIH